MAITLLEWPSIWFGILLKPGKTANRLKNEELGFKEGMVSIILAFLLVSLIGIIFFMAMAVISGEISSILMGLLFIIIYFVIFIILFLIALGILRISSMVLKGKGNMGAECGYLGVIGSAALILYAVLYAVLLGIMMLIFTIIGVGAMAGGMYGGGESFGLAFGITFIVMGILMMPFSILGFILLAFGLDWLADIEKVSIYRSGAILGLFYGILIFLFFILYGLFFIVMMSAMPQPGYYGGYY